MNLFEAVKDTLTTREVAERYGLQVKHGMCRCPFHNDKNPSMKVDKRFHCFGCGADGDVIHFAERFFNLSPKDAAMKLAADFGIGYDEHQHDKARPTHRAVSDSDVLKHKASYCYNELIHYRNTLLQWQRQYAPQDPDEPLHPRFLEALHQLNYVEYQLDILLLGPDEEKMDVISSVLQKEALFMEPTNHTPVYRESAAYAREHNELKEFRDSYWTNIACKNDIEDAIAQHFDGMHLDKDCVTEVLDKYGPERLSLVLAATVQVKAWDGRFSSANKDWAFTIDFPDAQTARGFDRRDEYAVGSHPAVLDGFIQLARKEMKERAQTHAQETAKAAPAEKTAKPKHKSHDMVR